MKADHVLSGVRRAAGVVRAGVSIPFDAIRDAGTYVCAWDGCLLRVPPGAFSAASRPINIVGLAPLFVTKISDDPDVPVGQARQMAAKLDLPTAF
jgi:hypothetical protein